MAIVNPNQASFQIQAKAYELNVAPRFELKNLGKVNALATKYLAKVEFNPSGIEGSPKFVAEIPMQADSPLSAIKMLHGVGEYFKKAKDFAEFNQMVQKLSDSCVVMTTTAQENGYTVEFSELNKAGTGFDPFETHKVFVSSSQHQQMIELLKQEEAETIHDLPEEAPTCEIELRRRERAEPILRARVGFQREEETIAQRRLDHLDLAKATPYKKKKKTT